MIKMNASTPHVTWDYTLKVLFPFHGGQEAALNLWKMETWFGTLTQLVEKIQRHAHYVNVVVSMFFFVALKSSKVIMFDHIIFLSIFNTIILIIDSCTRDYHCNKFPNYPFCRHGHCQGNKYLFLK